MVDKELTKLTLYRVINVFFSGAIQTFCGVYIVKYVNILVDLDNLYSVGMTGSVIALIMIQIIKQDRFLDWCQNHMFSLLYICNIIEAIVLGLLWVSPVVYLISKVIYHHIVEKIISSAWSDMNNFIFTGRQRSKYHLVEGQAKHLGYISGSIVGCILDDLSITPIIVVAIFGALVDLPLSTIRLIISQNRIKRLGLR